MSPNTLICLANISIIIINIAIWHLGDRIEVLEKAMRNDTFTCIQFDETKTGYLCRKSID